MRYKKILEETRIIGILRGVNPNEVLEVAELLVKSGIKLIEVPLNSPDAFKSIEILVNCYKDSLDVLIGAGTVCSVKDVVTLRKIGARLIISPNTDPDVIKYTNDLDMISIPGFLTPSEAYAAINAGAKSVKLFPFKSFGISYYNNIKVILPPNFPVIVVGGVDESNIEDYLQGGIRYFGLGSSLYKPGMDLGLMETKAKFFVKAVREHNV